MITIKLTNGSEYVVDEYKFDKIIKSQTQIIQLTDWDGNITGEGFNKAYITEFYVDIEKTKEIQNKISAYNKLSKENKLQNHIINKVGAYYEKHQNLRLN
jgi:hypothetical protein